jgi:hypothetical protein
VISRIVSSISDPEDDWNLAWTEDWMLDFNCEDRGMENTN